ncbi:MAG: YjbE family putative metal transport protein [Acetobacteraceae bacterium]|nr:YjbE family putative metal transport protein [Acetobacteraceae bacterium]
MEELLGSSHLLLEIIWLNAILSGDNAIVIGIAAAGLPAEQRARAVLFGVIAAAVLRIIFSFGATWLLELWWIDIVGGLALLWIAWGFFQELGAGDHAEGEHTGPAGGKAPQVKTMATALRQIIVADVSMSLDNVLAVAAVARSNYVLLAVGLLISIVMMGLLGSFLAKLIEKFKVIAYVGVALIVYIALELIVEGVARADEMLGLDFHIHDYHVEGAIPWLVIAASVGFWLGMVKGRQDGNGDRG